MPLPPSFQVILDRMQADPRLVYFATYQPAAWQEAFGAARVRFFPIAEHAMIGAAIGAAIAGLRPIVHLNRATFSFVAMDQIANQAAKLRYMSGGQFAIGIILRAHMRGPSYLGAQHDQSPYSMFTHIPGIKVAVPATVEDAAGLYLTAMDDPNPVLVFESQELYTRWDPASPQDVPALPFGQARIWREGQDLTIVAIGDKVFDTLAAAERLEQQGVSCTVIDPRTLVPLDLATISASVQHTRRLLVVDNAPATASFAAELIASICEQPALHGVLLHPPMRLNGAPVPTPFSPALQPLILPGADQIVQAATQLVNLVSAGAR